MPLLHKAARVLLLSGTPALSRPLELFTQLHALSPRVWPDLKSFAARYGCVKRKKGSGGTCRRLALCRSYILIDIYKISSFLSILYAP